MNEKKKPIILPEYKSHVWQALSILFENIGRNNVSTVKNYSVTFDTENSNDKVSVFRFTHVGTDRSVNEYGILSLDNASGKGEFYIMNPESVDQQEKALNALKDHGMTAISIKRGY